MRHAVLADIAVGDGVCVGLLNGSLLHRGRGVAGPKYPYDYNTLNSWDGSFQQANVSAYYNAQKHAHCYPGNSAQGSAGWFQWNIRDHSGALLWSLPCARPRCSMPPLCSCVGGWDASSDAAVIIDSAVVCVCTRRRFCGVVCCSLSGCLAAMAAAFTSSPRGCPIHVAHCCRLHADDSITDALRHAVGNPNSQASTCGTSWRPTGTAGWRWRTCSTTPRTVRPACPAASPSDHRRRRLPRRRRSPRPRRPPRRLRPRRWSRTSSRRCAAGRSR